MQDEMVRDLNGGEDIRDLNVVMMNEMKALAEAQGISFIEASKIWNDRLSTKAENKFGLEQLMAQAALLEELKNEAMARGIDLQEVYDLWAKARSVKN